MKAPAATGTKPASIEISFSSRSASSKALLPYTTTITAGVPLP